MILRRISLLAFAAFAIACANAGTPSGDADADVVPIEDTGADTIDVALIDVADDVDDATDTQPDVEEDTADVEVLREVGDLCDDDDQCESGLCLPLDLDSGQGFCSQICGSDRDCPRDFDCVELPTSGTDIESACLAADFCLDVDEDGYGVGPGCLGDDCDDAAPEVYVNAPELCNGQDDDCDGAIDDGIPEVGDACDSGFPGVCEGGVRACDAGQWTCEPSDAPTAERCNLVDDDCDGSTDEGDDGEPLARACYSGPTGTQDVGACSAGRETCLDGAYTTCTGQVTPIAELCNGVDDDCDGLEDERNPESGGACVSDQPGLCSDGRFECVDGARTCVPLRASVAEVCNGEDDDCDGFADEDEDGEPLARACYSGPTGTEGVGVCTGGAETCSEGGFGTCVGQTLPSPEICDGLNNDCDADGADEGNPGGGLACSTGEEGVCGAGTTRCSDGGIVCDRVTAPSMEICNGVDDDCDGVTDEAEGGGPLVRSCYSGSAETEGVGECAAGTQTCSGGTYGPCGGQTLPSVEVCDGRNNDCDADGVDEGNPGGGLACATGQHGVCNAGTTLCSGGSIACIANTTGSAETCNGVDDDCDGATDEAAGGSALTQSCYDGPAGTEGVGICRSGTRTCASGSYGSCVGQVQPAGGETCNGQDDDCDRTSDEGCPTGYAYSGSSASTQFGGGGGDYFSDSNCQVIIGFQGYTGSKVDRLRAVCGTISVNENTGTSPWSYTITRSSGATGYTSYRGGGGGSYFSQLCPSGRVVTGIRGRDGSEIDAFGFQCSALQINGTPGSYTVSHTNAYTATQRGGGGGDTFRHDCANGQVARSVFGRSGARIDAYGIRCSAVDIRTR